MREQFMVVTDDRKYLFVHKVIPENTQKKTSHVEQWAVCKHFFMHVAKYLKDVGLLLLVHLDPWYYSGCLMVFPHRSTLIGWPTCVPMRITICKPNFAPNRRICPVLLAYSETAEVWAQANRLSLSCSFILFCIDPPVSQRPIYIFNSDVNTKLPNKWKVANALWDQTWDNEDINDALRHKQKIFLC